MLSSVSTPLLGAIIFFFVFLISCYFLFLTAGDKNLNVLAVVAIIFLTVIFILYLIYKVRNQRTSLHSFYRNGGLNRSINMSNIDFRNLQLSLMQGDFTGDDYELLQSLDDNVDSSVKYGLEDSDINRLPLHVITVDDLQKRAKENLYCSICLEPFVIDDVIRTIFCLHSFHQTCIDKWLHMNAICPICKYPAISNYE